MIAAEIAPRLKRGSRILVVGREIDGTLAQLQQAGHYAVARESETALDAPPGYFDAAILQLDEGPSGDPAALLDAVRSALHPGAPIAVSGSDASGTILRELRQRFVQQTYRRENAEGAFAFIGTPATGWPILVGGPEARKIVLAEHNPEWRLRFEIERRRIVAALGACVRRIEHVGSTSVPGLAAKPIVDIAVGVEDPLDEEHRAALEAAGYALRVEEPEHRMFRTPQRDVHVHLWSADSPEIDRLLRFRDRLRENAADRAIYERVKRELAKREWRDTNQYAEAKSAVVAEILSRTLP